MASFATLQEFADFMQASITNSAATLALDASTARIQSETGQQFWYVQDDTITVRGNGGRITLPQRPVWSVSSVTTRWIGDAETTTRVVDLDYTHWNGELDWVVGGYVRVNASPKWSTYGYDWPEYVDVVYTHGYTTIPADVKLVNMQLAAEVYTAPDGVGYESIDDYAWRRGDASKTPAMLGLEALVRKYSIRSQMVRVR